MKTTKYSELPKEIKLQDDVDTLLDVNEELRQRIDKATDILDNSSHYLKICIDNDLTPMQLASKILKGEIEVIEDTPKEMFENLGYKIDMINGHN